MLIGIVSKKAKQTGKKKVMKNTRGMMKVEGLDFNDDPFDNPRKDSLTLDTTKLKETKKKKKCCWIF